MDFFLNYFSPIVPSLFEVKKFIRVKAPKNVEIHEEHRDIWTLPDFNLSVIRMAPNKNRIIDNLLITINAMRIRWRTMRFPLPPPLPPALLYCAFSNEKYGSNETDYVSTRLIERNCDYYMSYGGTKVGCRCSMILKPLLDRWQTNLQRYACAIHVFERSFNWIPNDITAIYNR